MVAPVPLKNGKVVVDIEKVGRDLSTLLNSLAQSKFFKFLVTTPIPEQDLSRDFSQSSADYRAILNCFFKCFSQMNQSVEELASESDICR
jgi:hypothetical protein